MNIHFVPYILLLIACQLNEYSDTGFYPCLSCPSGYYQPSIGQTSCILGKFKILCIALSHILCLPAIITSGSVTPTVMVENGISRSIVIGILVVGTSTIIIIIIVIVCLILFFIRKKKHSGILIPVVELDEVAPKNVQQTVDHIYSEIRETTETDTLKAQFCICNKIAEFTCSDCGVQGYCSAACQKQHWETGHQKECHNIILHNTIHQPSRLPPLPVYESIPERPTALKDPGRKSAPSKKVVPMFLPPVPLPSMREDKGKVAQK